MATRTNENWEARNFWSFGPKYRLDVSNPEMGGDGASVYKWYAVTENDDVQLTTLTEGGTYRIHNDKTIEMVAGGSNPEKSVDIVISSIKGDINITCEGNGLVRIKGSSVMIQADEDIDLDAKRNVNISSGSGEIKLNGNKVEVDGLSGNLVESTIGSFLQKVFENAQCGSDFLSEEGLIEINL